MLKLKNLRIFRINDLDIKSFLKIILAIQLTMLGVVGIDAVGLNIPILRPFIGFVYLTFVPGILILKILKIHNLDKTKFVLYSAGLSITFIMFAGALTNSLLHSLKISQPISTLPLMATLTFLVVILCVAAYIRDREFQPSGIYYADTNNLLSPSYPFLLLLPFLAIFGTFFINFYQNNTLLLLLLFLIALVAALIAFDKFIPAKAYSVAIFTIAVSLVLHVSLISPYPYGWNIDHEYYFSELIATNSYWDSSLSFTGINSLLSIVMLAPIYSKMLSINIIWVFKAIYPFIHSLLPLAIFAACKEQIGSKKAFFSSFFFMSLGGFFGTMVLFRREQIALLFFALLVLVMVDNKLTSIQKSALAIAFVISLPVSHYGTSYLSLTIFFFGWALLHLTSNKQTIFNKKISKKVNENTGTSQKNASSPSILKLGMILICLVFMLSWFMYIAGGSSFIGYVSVIENSFISLNDFFNPESTPEVIYGALGMGLQQTDVLGGLFRIVHYSTEVFIVVGFIALIIRPKIFKLKEEYRALLIVTALFLFTIMFLPAIGPRWSTFRFYNFVLIIIAPLIVFGCEAIWKLTSWLIKSELLPMINKLKQHNSPLVPRYHNRNNQVYLKFLVLFILVPYFLFNTGFVYAICDESKSTRLVPWKVDNGYFNDREVSGAEWLDGVSSERAIVVGDGRSTDLLSFWFPWRSSRRASRFALEKKVHKNAYIFFRTWNVEKQEVLIYDGIRETNEYINPDDIPELRYAINIRNKVYDNGGAQVFAPG